MILSTENRETGLALLIEQISRRSDPIPQMGEQVAHVRLRVDGDVAVVIKLPGV
jgi:hypothetical protein